MLLRAALFFLYFASAHCELVEFETDISICVLNDDFLVKQIKSSNPDEQFLLVVDATACALAADLNLPMNRIKILAAGVPFIGKKHLKLPATWHTLAPGRSVLEWGEETQIHQRVRKGRSPLLSPFAPEEEGLSPAVIRNMAMHDDLSQIAAFDTFIGNADRSQSNLFYDPITHRYFGIDLAASFCSDLPKAACRQLERFRAEKRQFSKKEKAALAKYGETLEELLNRWPPERIEKLLLELAAAAGF